ncbi:cytoplasmic dynein 2 light intermediate chain 1 isoform X2 [Episyrphus balteatus]|uniref:cytoplasmic dynein 2 light intermediate chain 1 isoform X2 n=1 Tax=Episyrphus balteatus TaxID=286459 RepID=UPI002486156D|nr:cytoplasmic dynein 2 light intermediate chain 1 isoform X2 [Episyrphus balteatus]
MFLDKSTSEKTESIQEIAIKLLEEQIRVLEIDNDPKERTIFILGSKGVGKSTAINSFFEKEELVRPTLALEYTYGKRTSSTQGIQKQILHVWELGSLENSEQLIDVPLRSHGANNFAVILFIDLSQPKTLWLDLDNAYKGLKNAYTNLLNETELAVFMEKSIERVGKEHSDQSIMMDLFPFPLIIVGGKYDIFMDFDPELKKHICRCLRSMAHVLGASLLFYSKQIPKLAKTMRDTISHLGYGSPTQPFRSVNIDYNAPLSVWFGSDNWDQIENTNSNVINDPAKDPGFQESIIDELREQKNQELAALIKENEMRGKFETIDG